MSVCFHSWWLAVVAVLFLFLNPAGRPAKDLTAVRGNKTQQQHPCLVYHVTPLCQVANFLAPWRKWIKQLLAVTMAENPQILKIVLGSFMSKQSDLYHHLFRKGYMVFFLRLLNLRYSLQQHSWHNTTLLLVCQSQSLRTVISKPFNYSLQSYHLN